MKKDTLTRYELHEYIWTGPMTNISRRFSVSIDRIKKVCTKYNIPIPPSGHWQRIKLGKEPEIQELPVDESLKEDTIINLVSIDMLRRNRQNIIKEDIEETCKDLLKVTGRLLNPDKLILEAKRILDNKELRSFGKSRDLVFTGYKQVHISVTKKNIGRALRLMDAFIKLVKVRGHKIDYIYSEIKIIISKEDYEFGIREKQNRIESNESYSDYDYVPTGKLVIFVGKYSRKREFIDGKTPLESQLSKILAYLEYLGEKDKEDRINNEIWWRKQEEKEM